MYYKRNPKLIFRDYEEFGYITDNRNFGYHLVNDDENVIGDKIISKSGVIFFSVLSNEPQEINCLAEKIAQHFSDVDLNIIREDAIEFYGQLSDDGFVIVGSTWEDCERNDRSNLYKKIPDDSDKENNSSFEQNNPQEFLKNYFLGEPQLTDLHIEITGRCNERCLHCYIPHKNKGSDMDTRVFYNILEQCREMRVLHLTLSGGEPMLHKNFIDFLSRCHEYNFSVNILSNLTELNQGILEEIKKNKLICIQTSIYSMDATIHDSITQKNGSLERTKASLLTLIKNNVPVQISCPIMKQNIEHYQDVIKWGNEHNVKVISDYELLGEYDFSVQNLDNRLSLSDVKKYINKKIEHGPEYLDVIQKEAKENSTRCPEDFVCSVCRYSLCINEKGIVYPCVGWQSFVLGDIQEDSLDDIWRNSEKTKSLRELRRRDFTACLQCPDQDFCNICLARNANEDPSGNPFNVNKFYCNIAKLNREMLIENRGEKSFV